MTAVAARARGAERQISRRPTAELLRRCGGQHERTCGLALGSGQLEGGGQLDGCAAPLIMSARVARRWPTGRAATDDQRNEADENRERERDRGRERRPQTQRGAAPWPWAWAWAASASRRAETAAGVAAEWPATTPTAPVTLHSHSYGRATGRRKRPRRCPGDCRWRPRPPSATGRDRGCAARIAPPDAPPRPSG